MTCVIRNSGLLVFLLCMVLMESAAQHSSGRTPDLRDVFNGRNSDEWAAEQQAQGFRVPAGQKPLEAKLREGLSLAKSHPLKIFQGTAVMRKPSEAILVSESAAWQQAVSVFPKPQKTQPGFMIIQVDTTICADHSGSIILLKKIKDKTQCVFFIMLSETNSEVNECATPVHLTMNATTLAGGESLLETMTQTIIHFAGDSRTLLEQYYYHYRSPNDEAILMQGKLWEKRDAWAEPRSIDLKP